MQNQSTVFQVPELRHISTPKNRDDLIASRTRSRLPMEDVQVEELEALFQAPDFEPPSFAPEDLDDEEIIWHGMIHCLLRTTNLESNKIILVFPIYIIPILTGRLDEARLAMKHLYSLPIMMC